MVAKVVTVAFEGVEARRVDVEVQLTGGQVCFVLVGLGDKAVGESRERVRAAFAGLGLALPARRLVVNLAPADLPKEGSHYDLPIALHVGGVNGYSPTGGGWPSYYIEEQHTNVQGMQGLITSKALETNLVVRGEGEGGEGASTTGKIMVPTRKVECRG